jgi:hypothetical protein
MDIVETYMPMCVSILGPLRSRDRKLQIAATSGGLIKGIDADSD